MANNGKPSIPGCFVGFRDRSAQPTERLYLLLSANC